MEIINYIIIFLLIIIFLIAILFFIEKSLNKRLVNKQKNPKYLIKKEIKSLKKSKLGVDKKFLKISEIGKNYLIDKFNLSSNSDYSEILENIIEKGNHKEENFCKKILKINYQKEKPSKKDVDELLNILEDISGLKK